MIGGYMSFQGIEAKARYAGTPVEQALPVSMMMTDDRVEVPQGFSPSVVQSDHPVMLIKGFPVDAQEPFELENGILGLRHLDAAEIVWFARPPALTASFKVRLLQSTRFADFTQLGIATITVGVPGVQLTPGRVLVWLGYGPTKPRDYPRALCYTIEEFLVYTIAHELHHLTVSQQNPGAL
jgi:hypothetical protein